MTYLPRTKRNTVAAVVALGVAFSVTAAGQAGAAPAERRAAAAPSYYLKFDKGTVTNSRLSLMQSVSGPDRVIKSYKAGSGTSTNTCAVGKGWLPNGKYRIEFRRTNFDGLINGYVIKVTDKRCHNGTKRTELFIHSEMKPNGGQGRIESEKWTDTNPNDYYSNGCIKLNPTNIKALFAKAGSLGWSRVKGLVVTS
ncbi:L,D-transpeptidase family protein [Streptomyces uncialis]|uniref:L,D-transpeptidase family protein n=1 Tax=Streptomyces uncialis TaxID=1048205 RepID=UPI003825786B